MTLRKTSFQNIVGKGEIAGYQNFLHFPQCFQAFPREILTTSVIFILSSALNLDQSKILYYGKELTLSQMTNFTLFQTERVCRRHFKLWENG